MTRRRAAKKVLLVDDEQIWLKNLSRTIRRSFRCQVAAIADIELAQTYLATFDPESCDLIVIDLQLRDLPFDQGGLSLVDLVRAKTLDVPIVLVTGYPLDHPDVRKLTGRYRDVEAYDKETFLTSCKEISSHLFAKKDLPPQIGEPADAGPSARRAGGRQQGALLLGIQLMLFLLLSAVAFFLLRWAFPDYTLHQNVVFLVLVMIVLSVLLKIFGGRTVRRAFDMIKGLKPDSGDEDS